MSMNSTRILQNVLLYTKYNIIRTIYPDLVYSILLKNVSRTSAVKRQSLSTQCCKTDRIKMIDNVSFRRDISISH